MALWHRTSNLITTTIPDDDGSVSLAYSHAQHHPGQRRRRQRRRYQQGIRSRNSFIAAFVILVTIVFMIGTQRYQLMIQLTSSSSHLSLASMKWHPSKRRDRFPSMQKRVHVYMSIWYQPSDCNKLNQKSRIKRTVTEDGTAAAVAIIEVKSSGKEFRSGRAELNVPLWLTADLVQDCARSSQLLAQLFSYLPAFRSNDIPNRKETLPYCRDLQQDSNILFENDIPILAQFGDDPIDTSDGVPMFGKWRAAATVLPTIDEDTSTCRIPSLVTTTQTEVVYPPILWPLVGSLAGDDYGSAMFVSSSIRASLIAKARNVDTPWETKINKGVWRGKWNARKAAIITRQPNDDNRTSLCCPFDDLPCEFVLQHGDSDVINAGYYLPDDPDGLMRAQQKHQDEAGFVFKTKLNLQYLQQHKALFVLDAQDDENLLWSLSSSSVVIMPPPVRTSWIMEELLVPWTHYIPLGVNNISAISNTTTTTTITTRNQTAATDLLQWIETHDDEARKIAERASLFIYDLLFHPDAARDNEFIKKDILRRYRQYWE